MAFLRSFSPTDIGPVLDGAHVQLRVPVAADYAAWAELRARSREFLRPWEPSWSRDELSRASYRRRLRFYQRELREETGYAFFVFARDSDALVGGLSMSHVRRGVTQSCAVGYWVGQPFNGQGLMSNALWVSLPFAFETLGLHRVEAACLPSNAASIRVLHKVGFKEEGLARKYLKINGVWQDHLLFACLDDEWSRPAPL